MVDDNCDGVVDGYIWYLDCDADGYAAADATTMEGCTMPAVDAQGCSWTRTAPTADNIDCDDTKYLVHPGALYQTTSDPDRGWDYNCDGVITKEYTLANVDPAGACTLVSDPYFFISYCSGDDGWTGPDVPDCGQAADASLCGCDTACSGICFIGCNGNCVRTEDPMLVQGCR
jgi:hypothetical protein